MKIAGIQKNSFVDYRGKIAAVVFTPGCNLNCYYCHNRSILDEGACSKIYREKEVIQYLAERKRFLDGVVISGGEPTLQPDLEIFISEVKKLGYPVKLDTNGTNPDRLAGLIENKLLNYVAMDIKAPFERYEEICGVCVDTGKIGRSIDLLMKGQVDYEFRTTVAPDITEMDILAIAHRIKGASRYILQQYRKPLPDEEIVDYRLLKLNHTPVFLKSMSEKIKDMVRQNEIRGII